jgi:hypothetical protein
MGWRQSQQQVTVRILIRRQCHEHGRVAEQTQAPAGVSTHPGCVNVTTTERPSWAAARASRAQSTSPHPERVGYCVGLSCGSTTRSATPASEHISRSSGIAAVRNAYLPIAAGPAVVSHRKSVTTSGASTAVWEPRRYFPAQRHNSAVGSVEAKEVGVGTAQIVGHARAYPKAQPGCPVL